MKIAVIDYGVGNLASVDKALQHVGASQSRATRADDLAGADAVIVPGVGHFAATAALNRDWRGPVLDAIARRVPVLGICLGMQWLCAGSTEAPDVPGLGVITGTCVLLPGPVKVPHVGWNTLDQPAPRSRLLAGIPDNGAAYFTHSYALLATDDAVATTTHGRTFASVVERGLVFGAQWHPEKSGPLGLAVLANFVQLTAARSC